MRRTPRVLVPLALAAALPLLSACGPGIIGLGSPVTVPSSDPTPPTLTLTIRGFQIEHSVSPGDGRLNIQQPTHPAQSILLLAVAEDEDGGVRDVAIEAFVNFTCWNEGDGYQHVRLPDGPVDPNVDNPDDAAVGDEARTMRTVASGFRRSQFQVYCRNTFGDATELADVVFVQARASAENFGGGQVWTPWVDMSLQPLPDET